MNDLKISKDVDTQKQVSISKKNEQPQQQGSPPPVDPIDEIADQFADSTLQKMVKQRNKFDGYFHFYYLFNRKVQEERDSLLSLLSKRHESVIHFYLPQMCRLAIERCETADGDPTDFGKFISSKSSNSMHFALKADWQFKGIADDNQSEDEAKKSVWLSDRIETSVVSARVEGGPRHNIDDRGTARSAMRAAILNRSGSKCSIEEPTPQMLEPNLRQRTIAALTHRSKLQTYTTMPDSWGARQSQESKIGLPSSPEITVNSIWDALEQPALSTKMKADDVAPDLIWFLTPRIRLDYFNMTGRFCNYLIDISDSLALEIDRTERLNIAAKCFQKINHWIFCQRALVAASEQTFCMKGLCIPMDRIGPDPEVWSETGKELLTEWDERVVEVVNNPEWEEGSIQHTPNAVQILKIASKECRVLSSAKRAPYLLLMETGDLDEDLRKLVSPLPYGQKVQEIPPDADEQPNECERLVDPNSAFLKVEHTNNPQRPFCWNDLYTYRCVLQDIKNYNLYIPRNMTSPVRHDQLTQAEAFIAGNVSHKDVDDETIAKIMLSMINPENPIDAIRRSLQLHTDFDAATTPPKEKPKEMPHPLASGVPSPEQQVPNYAVPEGETPHTWAPKLRRLLWGETWHEKKERLRRASPYGGLDSWDMHAVLVKGGDDLRQEFLAQQLIRTFRAIFEDLGVPLWVRPYEILVTGFNSGIMEFVPDSASFGSLKQKYGNESFARCFEASFADKLEQAQLNFVHSHAAYSLISYLINVKDRHNGNLLLLTSGHCIHIDFGFMLSNAPGNNIANVIAGGAFENSPFKLTQEIMDILGGCDSEMFDYFKRLIIYGFLGVRKSAERILHLIEMMKTHYKMPCFSDNPDKSVEEMKERFMLDIKDEICIQNIQSLITLSINNWRSVQYDYYQKAFNKIW
eukprot:GHVH01008107.1.p1 GENE.GHVH01008107.1~~GHVH01008107.1.p1  ORF type:complete len:917 (+),score=135.59 GHVH01008107.1:211-2961(+)